MSKPTAVEALQYARRKVAVVMDEASAAGDAAKALEAEAVWTVLRDLQHDLTRLATTVKGSE